MDYLRNKTYLFIAFTLLFIFPSRIFAQEETEAWQSENHWIWYSNWLNTGSSQVNNIAYLRDTSYIFVFDGVLKSYDGINWEPVDFHTHEYINDVCLLNGKLYGLAQNSRRLYDRSGQYLEGVTAKMISAQFAFIETSIPGKNLLITNTDTFRLQEPNTKVFALNDVHLLCIELGSSNSSYILNTQTGKRDTLNLDFESTYSFTIIPLDDTWYFKAGNQLFKIWLDDTKRFSSTSFALSDGDKLHAYGNSLVLKSNGNIQILHGNIPAHILTSLEYHNIEKIIQHGNHYFAFSRTSGLGTLLPPGVFSKVHCMNPRTHVGGLFKYRDQDYCINWTSDFNNEFVGSLWTPQAHSAVLLSYGEVGIAFVSKNAARDNIINKGYLKTAYPHIDTTKFERLHVIQNIATNVIVDNDSTFLYVDTENNFSRLELINGEKTITPLLTLSANVQTYHKVKGSSPVEYWFYGDSTLYLVNHNYQVTQVIDAYGIRSVQSLSDGYILASYGRGLSWLQNRKNTPILYNNSRNNRHISEVGFQNGVFYLFSNEGIFAEDSAFAANQIINAEPLYIRHLNPHSPIETNGGLFSTSIRRDEKSRWVATTTGVMSFELPTELDPQVKILLGADPIQLERSFAPNSPLPHSSSFFVKENDNWTEVDLLEASVIKYDEAQLYLAGMDRLEMIRIYPQINYALYAIGFLALLILTLTALIYKNKRKQQLQLQLQTYSLKSAWTPNNLTPQENQSLFALLYHDLSGGVNLLRQVLDSSDKSDDPELSRINNLMEKFKTSMDDRFQKLIHQSDKSTSLSVDEISAQAISEVSEYAKFKRIEIQNGISHQDLHLVNSELFTRALHICLSNAIKYSPSHSTVQLKSRKTTNYLILDIIDNGPGVPKMDKDGNYPVRLGHHGERGLGTALKLIHKLLLTLDVDLLLVNRKDSRGAHAMLSIPLKLITLPTNQ